VAQSKTTLADLSVVTTAEQTPWQLTKELDYMLELVQSRLLHAVRHGKGTPTTYRITITKEEL